MDRQKRIEELEQEVYMARMFEEERHKEFQASIQPMLDEISELKLSLFEEAQRALGKVILKPGDWLCINKDFTAEKTLRGVADSFDYFDGHWAIGKQVQILKVYLSGRDVEVSVRNPKGGETGGVSYSVAQSMREKYLENNND